MEEWEKPKSADSGPFHLESLLAEPEWYVWYQGKVIGYVVGVQEDVWEVRWQGILTYVEDTEADGVLRLWDATLRHEALLAS